MNYDNVAAGIIALLKTVTYTDSSSFYQQVFDGEPKNFEDITPTVTVSMIPPFDSHRYTGGGKIKETSRWQLVTYLDLDDQQKAEQLMRYVASTVVPLFQEKVQLGGVTGIFSSRVVNAFPAYLPVQKLLYRAFVIQLEVQGEYFVEMTT